MTQLEINEIIERHQHYLNRDCENWQDMRADFRYKDLRNAIFRDVSLQEANFRFANFKGADFSYANLYKADFYGANLQGADFEGANLDNASFYSANLYQADFYEASLINTNFSYAFLVDTGFIGANLTEAVFFGADCVDAEFGCAELHQACFNNANIFSALFYRAKNIPYIPMICPEEGAFIGWKKVHSYIIKLEIPAGAKRSSATTRKCRCEYAKVLGIYDINGGLTKETEVINTLYSQPVTYKIGEMVYPDSFDENRWNECSHGIHFFINKQEAIEYNW